MLSERKKQVFNRKDAFLCALTHHPILLPKRLPDLSLMSTWEQVPQEEGLGEWGYFFFEGFRG